VEENDLNVCDKVGGWFFGGTVIKWCLLQLNGFITLGTPVFYFLFKGLVP